MESLAVLSSKLVKVREQRKMASWVGSWEGKVFSLQRQQSPSPYTALFLSASWFSVFLLVLETGSQKVDLADLELVT